MIMKDHITWQYNEFKQVGKDYGLLSEVEVYDSSHSDFRDIEKESSAVLDILQPGEQDVIIDFGSGSGTFAIQAALRCAKVYAVDVSQPMIDYAKLKAEKAGVSNIEKHNAIENITALIKKLAIAGGNFLQEDAEGHFREEFSTYDWIMDGLLARAGFEIKSKDIQDGVLGTYHCIKQ